MNYYFRRYFEMMYFPHLKKLNEAQLLEIADFAISAERYGSFDPLLPLSEETPKAWLETITNACRCERVALVKECMNLIQQRGKEKTPELTTP
jgi:hypothetical protein